MRFDSRLPSMRFQPIDKFASTLPADKRASVYQSTKATHEKRTKLLFDQFADPNRLRELAGRDQAARD
jgi:L-lactate dehydrogenase complex protein LldF